ncbi:speckle-type POZ protein-like [Paramacrobiotus metropolitanus]|uniref:speckle-type POZ protein-like n=1 Tax=Paramacrobiotus metropolitanus TaxID=2943436 RepID=UPI002445ADAF|nr:speckle-type POZ protein-like [Paramacrobiotus metropolitanus]
MSIRTAETGDMDHLVPIAAPPRRIVQFNYEWRIGNFKRAAMKEEVLRSQPFASKDPQKCKWILELYPHGAPDVYNQGYTSVFLVLKDCFPESHIVAVTVQFGIRKFGPDIKDVYFEASDVDFEKERRFGLIKFMAHPELFEKENHFLHHDSATILCDVKITNAFESSTPPPPLPPPRETFIKRTASFGSPKNFFRSSTQKRHDERPILQSDIHSNSVYDSGVATASPRSSTPLNDHTGVVVAPPPAPRHDPGVIRGIDIPRDSLLDDMVQLLSKGRYSDVTLDVGKREFHVHKAILAARSPVFDSMFSNPANATSNHFVITDVTSRGMKELLYFIYTGHIDKTENIVEEVLEAGQKYQVAQLQAICESLILRELNVDNAIKTLILAHEHKALQLKEIVLEFIARNFQAVKRTEGWNVLRSSHTDLYGDIIEYM